MTGLYKILPHVATILLIWGIIMIIIPMMKRFYLKGLEKLEIEGKDFTMQKKRTEQVAWFANWGVSVVAAASLVFVVFFLWSPFQRDYEEMDRIGVAEVDPEYKPPSKEDLTASNKESVEKPSNERKQAAKQDTDQAMTDFIKMSQKAADDADVKAGRKSAPDPNKDPNS